MCMNVEWFLIVIINEIVYTLYFKNKRKKKKFERIVIAKVSTHSLLSKENVDCFLFIYSFIFCICFVNNT